MSERLPDGVENSIRQFVAGYAAGSDLLASAGK
jgi:hypothetical protein